MTANEVTTKGILLHTTTTDTHRIQEWLVDDLAEIWRVVYHRGTTVEKAYYNGPAPRSVR